MPQTVDHDERTTHRWHEQFPSGRSSVGRARRRVGEVLGGWGYGGEAADLVLLVCGELAANAVEHARCSERRFEVALIVSGADCTVEVSDASDRVPRRRQAAPDDESGRGLALVDALAQESGCRPRDPIGKTVWARLWWPHR